jgi:hypothetical protein
VEGLMLEMYLSLPTTKEIDLESKKVKKYAIRDTKSQMFKPRKGTYDPLTLKYLVEGAWGLANNYHIRLRAGLQKKEAVLGVQNGSCPLFVVPDLLDSSDEQGGKSKSVIDDYALADRLYTTKYLITIHECRRLAQEDLNSVDRETYSNRFSAASERFNTPDEGNKQRWEMERRRHLHRQNSIREEIIDAIKKNPKRSWKGIEADIGHWCSTPCIRRWVTSRDGYRLYAERVIPLLSDKQRKAHYNFARLFRTNWRLGEGKYLLVHYD